jgi:hypothetical protein
VDFARLALKPDGVNLGGRRQSSHRYGHRVAPSFAIDDVLEQKGFSVALLQAAELPAHERHQLGVFVDRPLDAQKLVALLESAQMLAKIFVPGSRHCRYFLLLTVIYRSAGSGCQAVARSMVLV